MPFKAPFVQIAVLLSIATSGCAAHHSGLIRSSEGHVRLVELNGDETKLKLTKDTLALGSLDGPSVEVWGKTGFAGAVTVTKYRVQEGNHGLPVWVGTLKRHGVQLGIDDMNSGAFYLMGEPAWPSLEPFVGQTVMVEGFVDGPHRVNVTYFQVLEGESAGESGELDVHLR